MKYKVGDRVKIKSLDWYNENKNQLGRVSCGSKSYTIEMCFFCGKTLTIQAIGLDFYLMEEDNLGYEFTDEMIEGLAEEGSKPKFKVGDKITNGKGTVTILTLTSDSYILEDTFGECGTLYFKYQDKWKIVEEEVGLVDKLSSRWVNEFNLPNGYIFKDENGNVINATKIVLEKKKKEYPKTFEECVHVLEGENRMSLEQMNTFRKLIDARNAYWKLYGEEMGLGKPWELSIGTPIYYIYYNRTVGTIKNDYADDIQGNIILAFPTAEMRDVFKENFGPDIEFCKELL